VTNAQIPPPVKQGDPVSAARQNQILNLLAAAFRSSGMSFFVDSSGIHIRTPAVEKGWWGIIQAAGPASESDFTDARYWVKSASPSAGTAPADAVEMASRTTGAEGVLWVAATNMAEAKNEIRTTATHNLSAGTLVFVTMLTGPGATPHYIFSAGQAGSSVVTAAEQGAFLSDGSDWTDLATDHVFPSYLSVRPCSSQGTGINYTIPVIYIACGTPGSNPPGGFIPTGGDLVAFLPSPDKLRMMPAHLDGSSNPIPLAGDLVFGILAGTWWPRVLND
jgi:hypothetical protein